MSDHKPWPHQVDLFERAKNLNQFALFWPPGLGKSFATIELLRNRFNTNKKILRTLIVCPLIVTRNWQNEFAKFSKVPKEKIIRLDGSIAERCVQLKNHDGIAITNFDSFSNPAFLKAVLEWKPEALVVDEVHMIKNPSTKRTKAVHKVCEQMGENGYRLILTGTPLANSLMDIWALFYALDLGATFGKSFYGFRNSFFRNVNSSKPYLTFPNWVERPGCQEAVQKLIKDKSSVVSKSILNLPPLITQKIHVDLTPEQQRVYLDMKKNLIATIKDKSCVAQIALTKALRLQQIVSGFLPLDDGTTKTLPSNRPKVLTDLLEIIPANEKVIIWSVFHFDYKTIATKLQEEGITYTEAHGLISDKQKDINLDNFRNDPSIRCLIASPAAIGVGINIVCAAYSIWFSRNFSMIQDEQANARNHRPGSEMHKTVVRYNMVSEGTIDELVLESVEQKFNLAEKILNHGESVL